MVHVTCKRDSPHVYCHTVRPPHSWCRRSYMTKPIVFKCDTISEYQRGYAAISLTVHLALLAPGTPTWPSNTVAGLSPNKLYSFATQRVVGIFVDVYRLKSDFRLLLEPAIFPSFGWATRDFFAYFRLRLPVQNSKRENLVPQTHAVRSDRSYSVTGPTGGRHPRRASASARRWKTCCTRSAVVALPRAPPQEFLCNWASRGILGSLNLSRKVCHTC